MAANTERYRIAIKRVKRPLALPLQTGGGHCIDVRESVLLRVSTEAAPDHIGYGEAAPLPWFGTESAEQAEAALASIGEILQLDTTSEDSPTAGSVNAQNAVVTQTFWQDALERRLPHNIAERLDTAPCARWALECALRQIGALPALEQPTAQRQHPVPSIQDFQRVRDASAHTPPHHGTIPVAALLPAGTTELPQALLTAGFCVFKTKFGVRSFADEAASIATLLGNLRAAQSGHALKLRLDANAGLPASGLHAWLKLLEPFADWIDFVEQPLHPGQEQQTAAAFAGSPLAFAFDESLTSLPRLLHIAEQFPQAVLVVKPALLGSAEGFLRWRQQHTQTEQGQSRRIIYSSALETGIGIAHALGLAAAEPLPLEQVGFGTGALFTNDGLGAPHVLGASIAFEHNALMPSQAQPAQALRAEMEAIWKLA